MDMRAQAELQFLSNGGILKPSFKLIFNSKKIFSQITLALIVPLFVLVLARSRISKMFFELIDYNDGNMYGKLTLFLIFEIEYVTFLMIFSLLSTSAVVYTIACIYAAKQITFKKVIGVLPKVWKKMLPTFVVSYAIFSVFCLLGISSLVVFIVFLRNLSSGMVLIVFFAILFTCVLSFICIIWNMASVVSVMVEFKPVAKSIILIKGHIWVSFSLFVFECLAFGGIAFAYENIVPETYLFRGIIAWIYGSFVPVGVLDSGVRILVAILCFVSMVIVFFLVIVFQTVIYFVCKSYHNENIDRAMLARRLEVAYGNGAREEVQLVQAAV